MLEPRDVIVNHKRRSPVRCGGPCGLNSSKKVGKSPLRPSTQDVKTGYYEQESNQMCNIL